MEGGFPFVQEVIVELDDSWQMVTYWLMICFYERYFVMDGDAIRREIALLEREIAVIKHELREAKRDSVRTALRQELQEKEVELNKLSNQVNVNIGNDNNLSADNMIIGSTIGNDLNQYNQNNGVNASGAVFGDRAIIAGQNVYIYPNEHILKSRIPIDLKIYLEAILSKRVETTTRSEGLLFKREVTVSNDIWNEEAPFKVIAEIKDSVTKEVRHLILDEGLLQLEDTSNFLRVKIILYGEDKRKFIQSKSYITNEATLASIRNNIVGLFGKLSRDGYDVDDHILDFNAETIYDYRIDVYREAYKVREDGYDTTTHTDHPEIRAKSGKNRLDIFSDIITRRKNF
jgi:hypothetical protein